MGNADVVAVGPGRFRLGRAAMTDTCTDLIAIARKMLENAAAAECAGLYGPAAEAADRLTDAAIKLELELRRKERG